MGGNLEVNKKYEGCLPANVKKPRPESHSNERPDFIRGKYEVKQFVYTEDENGNGMCLFPQPPSLLPSVSSLPSSGVNLAQDKRHIDKQLTSFHKISGLGHAFYPSRRKNGECRSSRKGNIEVGMTEFVGLINVKVVRGTNVAIRDMVSSDPYVIISLGKQSLKTDVINNLNPVCNDELVLSIPDTIPPLKSFVYDKVLNGRLHGAGGDRHTASDDSDQGF